jgi:hypothetical protein
MIAGLEALRGAQQGGGADAVEHALRIAADLGPSDAPAAARLQALRDRLDATDALPIAVRPAR